MPGFTLHYLFGVETYRMLSPGVLQDTIHAHTAAYCLGLQGPDIFFYYPVSYLRKENIGGVMHEEHVIKKVANKHRRQQDKTFQKRKKKKIS